MQEVAVFYATMVLRLVPNLQHCRLYTCAEDYEPLEDAINEEIEDQIDQRGRDPFWRRGGAR